MLRTADKYAMRYSITPTHVLKFTELLRILWPKRARGVPCGCRSSGAELRGTPDSRFLRLGRAEVVLKEEIEEEEQDDADVDVRVVEESHADGALAVALDVDIACGGVHGDGLEPDNQAHTQNGIRNEQDRHPRE